MHKNKSEKGGYFLLIVPLINDCVEVIYQNFKENKGKNKKSTIKYLPKETKN